VSFPQVGVGGIVVKERQVLLIRRANEPLRGCWMIPGGTVTAGETLMQAVAREVLEETGIAVRPLTLACVDDYIERDGGRLLFHYVIVDYLCECVGGELRAGSDALDAVWVPLDRLGEYDLSPRALAIVTDALSAAG
jgi:8-oxo-dGTP diphosphatase